MFSLKALALAISIALNPLAQAETSNQTSGGVRIACGERVHDSSGRSESPDFHYGFKFCTQLNRGRTCFYGEPDAAIGIFREFNTTGEVPGRGLTVSNTIRRVEYVNPNVVVQGLLWGEGVELRDVGLPFRATVPRCPEAEAAPGWGV